MDLDIAGSNPVIHPDCKSFAELTLSVSADDRRRGLKGPGRWYRYYFGTKIPARLQLARRLPKYRHYRPKNPPVVRLEGRNIDLGKYNSTESHQEYHSVIAESFARGPRPIPKQTGRPNEADVSVNVILLEFLTRQTERHYRHADVTLSGEYDIFRDNLRPLERIYGSPPAREFSPKKWKAVRQSLIESGLSRRVINQRDRPDRPPFQMVGSGFRHDVPRFVRDLDRWFRDHRG